MKTAFTAFAITVLVLIIASGKFFLFLMGLAAFIFLAGVIDWSGDGDGREFPGRWREP